MIITSIVRKIHVDGKLTKPRVAGCWRTTGLLGMVQRENIDECMEDNFGATKTASGTFYPLPMMTVAEMDKLLPPGGTSVASFDNVLVPGGTPLKAKTSLPTNRALIYMSNKTE